MAIQPVEICAKNDKLLKVLILLGVAIRGQKPHGESHKKTISVMNFAIQYNVFVSFPSVAPLQPCQHRPSRPLLTWVEPLGLWDVLRFSFCSLNPWHHHGHGCFDQHWYTLTCCLSPEKRAEKHRQKQLLQSLATGAELQNACMCAIDHWLLNSGSCRGATNIVFISIS